MDVKRTLADVLAEFEVAKGEHDANLDAQHRAKHRVTQSGIALNEAQRRVLIAAGVIKGGTRHVVAGGQRYRIRKDAGYSGTTASVIERLEFDDANSIECGEADDR